MLDQLERLKLWVICHLLSQYCSTSLVWLSFLLPDQASVVYNDTGNIQPQAMYKQAPLSVREQQDLAVGENAQHLTA